MRLSIAMLADALPGYKRDSRVVAGKRTLRNARLLSESQVRSHSTLYLQQNSADTIACVNGNDVLFLHSGDADRCLNDILDVFDLYDDWADEVEALIAAGATLHDVLESIARRADMHLIVADATYLIREFAEGETHFEDSDMSQFVENRSMPLDAILRIDQDPKVRSASAGVYHVAFNEENTSLVCNLFVDGEHKGWLVANRNDSNFTQGDSDLLDAAKGMIEHWMRANAARDELWEQTAVIKQLVEGGMPDETLVRRALSVFGWSEGDTFRIFAVQPNALATKPTHVVQRFLSQAIPRSFTVLLEDGLMVIANETLAGGQTGQGASGDVLKSQRAIEDVLKTCGFRAGQSPAFSNILELPSQYGAACVAADAADTRKPLVAFESVKLPYALSLLHLNAVADVRHGALDVLSDYDEAHGTQLYETLRCFVRNRGSYARTYEELFIHRSTLQYRLERISEMCDLDYEEPTLWAHLQLSFLLDELA